MKILYNDKIIVSKEKDDDIKIKGLSKWKYNEVEESFKLELKEGNNIVYVIAYDEAIRLTNNIVNGNIVTNKIVIETDNGVKASLSGLIGLWRTLDMYSRLVSSAVASHTEPVEIMYDNIKVIIRTFENICGIFVFDIIFDFSEPKEKEEVETETKPEPEKPLSDEDLERDYYMEIINIADEHKFKCIDNIDYITGETRDIHYMYKVDKCRIDIDNHTISIKGKKEDIKELLKKSTLQENKEADTESLYDKMLLILSIRNCLMTNNLKLNVFNDSVEIKTTSKKTKFVEFI